MKKTKRKITYPLYRVVEWMIWVVFPKMKLHGDLPREPVILVGNHSQMYGPVACEWYLPRNRYTWCAGQMMSFKDVPAYAFEDFWSQKPKRWHPFYRVLSYLITPLAVLLFTNANTIPVWHDKRVITTFRRTVEKLEQGANIVIFPEHDVKHNHIVYDFQRAFVDVARLYYKRTGKELLFVPMYIAPRLGGMYFGEPTRFSAQAPIEEERERICRHTMDAITHMACSLPRHRVVPYRNIRKRDYPFNIPEVDEHEKTGG